MGALNVIFLGAFLFLECRTLPQGQSATGTFKTSSAIPEMLFDCYSTNSTTMPKPPATLTVLLELIRQIELDQQSLLNARMLSSSMLHSVILDGVRRWDGESGWTGVGENNDGASEIPYRATGREFYKHQLLADYLIPGQEGQFPKDALSKPEICLLHRLLSDTVDPPPEMSDADSCTPPHRTSPGRPRRETVLASTCPVKRGVVRTRWGPVSAGHLVVAAAAALEPQSVSFSRLMASVGKSVTRSSLSVATGRASDSPVNSLWVATAAGDLAEVVLGQATANPNIGDAGSWDDDSAPQKYYLAGHDLWEMTDADVLGSIDGIILADILNNKLPKIDIKLSQLIDMYYLDRKLVIDGIVTNRTEIFNKLTGSFDINTQVIGTAKLLREWGVFPVQLSDDDIAMLSPIAITKFKQVAANLMARYKNTEFLPDRRLYTALEIIIVIDGSWSFDDAQKIIYSLAEIAQVSYYGSSLGVINAESGTWLAPVSNRIFHIFGNITMNQNIWPRSGGTLSRGLLSILKYYQNNSTYVPYSHPTGSAILFLAPSVRPVDSDLASSMDTLRALKALRPQTNVVLVSDDGNGNACADLLSSAGNANDSLVRVSQDTVKHVQALVSTVAEKLENVVESVLPESNETGVLTGYVSPGIVTVYELHTEYSRRADYEIKFKGYQYGSVEICVLYPQGDKENGQIRGREYFTTTDNEIIINSRTYCSPDSEAGSPCYLKFQLTASNSSFVCLENECRYPNQVRIDVTSRRTSGSPQNDRGFGLISISLMLVMLLSWS